MGWVYRPIIRIELSNNGKVFPASALVDSGAASTMINSEIAEILGINLSLCSDIPVGGVGKTMGRECNVVLEIPEMKFKSIISAIFVEDLPFDVLLGQSDFFSAFDVRFEQAAGQFYIRKARKKTSRKTREKKA